MHKHEFIYSNIINLNKIHAGLVMKESSLRDNSYRFSNKLSVICLLFLFGCDLSVQDSFDTPELVNESLFTESLTYFEGKPYSESQVVRHAEQLENELSQIYEGFGGVWLDTVDKTTIVIALQKSEIFEANRENILTNLQTSIKERVIEKIAPSEGLSVSDYRFKTEEVAYSFRELQHIRDLLTPVIHQRNDIVESFIDVENNVFSIGVMAGSKLDDYNSLIELFSIEKNTVLFFETEPIKPDILLSSELDNSNLQSTLTLRDYIRPLRGGLQIEGRDPFNFVTRVCTFGFNVKLDGVDMWVTNSHCTSQFSSTSTTHFGQSIWTNFNDGTYVGSEFRDYSGINNTRYSDAALIEKSGQSSKFGYILMTDDYAHSWTNEGSVTLIPEGNNYRDMEIVDEYSDPIPHLGLHRIGRTAGWTTGSLSNACTTVSNIAPPMDGWTLYCQIRSTVYSGSGDSGSPVFQVVTIGTPGDHTTIETISLVGIHWGRNNSQQRSYHSPIDGIRNDLVQAGETLLTY